MRFGFVLAFLSLATVGSAFAGTPIEPKDAVGQLTDSLFTHLGKDLTGKTPDEGKACTIYLNGSANQLFSVGVSVSVDGTAGVYSSEMTIYGDVSGNFHDTVKTLSITPDKIDVTVVEHRPGGRTDWGWPYPGSTATLSATIERDSSGEITQVSVTQHHGVIEDIRDKATKTCSVTR